MPTECVRISFPQKLTCTAQSLHEMKRYIFRRRAGNFTRKVTMNLSENNASWQPWREGRGGYGSASFKSKNKISVGADCMDDPENLVSAKRVDSWKYLDEECDRQK